MKAIIKIRAEIPETDTERTRRRIPRLDKLWQERQTASQSGSPISGCFGREGSLVLAFLPLDWCPSLPFPFLPSSLSSRNMRKGNRKQLSKSPPRTLGIRSRKRKCSQRQGFLWSVHQFHGVVGDSSGVCVNSLWKESD